MKRVLLLIAVIVMVSLGANAQGIETFKNRLSQPDSAHFTRINIFEHAGVGTIIGQLSSRGVIDKVKGFRVRIFFDNNQSARQNAELAKKQFEESFPNVPAYMNYENPYFKVTVGNCATLEDAIILWGQIKNTFKKAFVTREDIPIEAFKTEIVREVVKEETSSETTKEVF